jgi:hypothetical protein
MTAPATIHSRSDPGAHGLPHARTNVSTVGRTLCRRHTMRVVHIVRSCLTVAAFVAPAALPPATASASQLLELPSVLVIAKSSNKNQVHDAALVTDECTPANRAPLRPYWQMLELGPLATEPLLDSEQRWLGLERQDVTNDTIQIALRALPSRTFTVHVARATDGRCSSWVGASVAGVPVRVAGIYVQQKLFGIDYVLLSGWAEDGALLRERISL